MEKHNLLILYTEEYIFQGVSSILSTLTALSYCSPLIDTFGKRFGQKWIGGYIVSTAEWLLFKRAVWLLAGLEVSLFLTGLSSFMWFYEDDALTKWCQLSAFGIDRKYRQDLYNDAEKQTKAYVEAMKEI